MLHRPNMFPVSKIVCETFLGSYGEFFDKWYSENGNFITILSNNFSSYFLMILLIWVLFDKKWSVAVSKPLKNTLRYRKHLQQVLLTNHQRGLPLKRIVFSCFPVYFVNDQTPFFIYMVYRLKSQLLARLKGRAYHTFSESQIGFQGENFP